MKTHSRRYSGILLAGGKSSRMGVDKAFLKYGNRYLYEYSLDALNSFAEDILISSSNLLFNASSYRRIDDEIPGLGPIGGLYSCLKKIKYNSAIVLPCDLPLINANIIETLLENSDSYDITVALNHKNLPEPLIGIYSKSVIPLLKNMIEDGHFKILDILAAGKTNFVKFARPLYDNFQNINTRNDFNSLPSVKPE